MPSHDEELKRFFKNPLEEPGKEFDDAFKLFALWDELEEAIARLIHRLRTMGEREVPSRLVGDLVMEELRALDEVAYVRFASVYRRFQDVTEFEEEIKRLQRITETAASREQMSLLPELFGKKK